MGLHKERTWVEFHITMNPSPTKPIYSILKACCIFLFFKTNFRNTVACQCPRDKSACPIMPAVRRVTDLVTRSMSPGV